MGKKFIKIGLVSISDRATKGEYEDLGLPHLKEWCQQAIVDEIIFLDRSEKNFRNGIFLRNINLIKKINKYNI